MDDLGLKLSLVVGLGNPGREYEHTRHNAGFRAVDRFASAYAGVWATETSFQARISRVSARDREALLCKPMTFMNASGESVARVARFYKIPLDKCLVVVDDADLALGTIRLRPFGSSGGHHGLESVEQFLGSQKFPRLRIGIGRIAPNERNIAGYVLGKFEADELPVLELVLERCRELVVCWITEGAGPAMNRFNGAVSPH